MESELRSVCCSRSRSVFSLRSLANSRKSRPLIELDDQIWLGVGRHGEDLESLEAYISR